MIFAAVLALVFFQAGIATTPTLTGGWSSSGPVLFQVSSVATGSKDLSTVYAASSRYDFPSQSALFRSPDAGKSWETLVQAAAGEFYSEIAVDPRDSQRLYAGATVSGIANIYRSDDAGQTWIKGTSVSPSCTPSFAPGSSHDTVLLACGQRVLRSQNAGTDWTALAAPFTEPTRLTAGPSGTVLAYGASGISRSSNDGDTWVSIASPPPTCSRILALRVDPTNPQVFVAGTGKLGPGGFECGGVFRSTNSGSTWGANALSEVYVTDVLIDPVSPGTLYASASYIAGILPKGGVFRSGDSGATWADLHVPALGAVRLALSPSGTQLHAATPIGVFDLGIRKPRQVPLRE